jgi:RNA polymerase sigma factor (sigma-70 family)
MLESRARIAEIYRRHAASVHRRAHRLLGDDAEAHEVLQDLFVSLLERPEQFTGGSAVNTFLYSATTHACLNRLRNRRNRKRLLEEQGAPSHVIPESDALPRVRQALSRMPAQLAEVAVYYFVDELSHQEIAELLGCSRRHVGNLVERLLAWGRAQEEACSAK